MKLISIPRPQRFNAPWEFVESLLRVKGWEITSQLGPYIDQNRNEIFERARKLDVEKLLMIDYDMVFKPWDIEKLEEDNLDIVGGLYRKGCDNHEYIIYGDYVDGKDAQLIEPTKGIMEVGGMGTGFMMLSNKVIQMKELESPFTRMIINGFLQGEDLSFCYRARQAGFKVYCDTDVKVGHIRHQIL